MSRIHKPELVAPAGNWSSLYSAVDGGADSVYFGVKGLNLRHLAENFDPFQLNKVMGFLRKNKKRGYLALNVIVYNRELDKVKKILAEAKKQKVDAVILWDMAVFSLAKELGLKVHLSTQASVANFAALKFYASCGVRRVVLARECTLADITAIVKRLKKEKVNCAVEAFIHGAMCVSISGRCFLSQYSFAKSANRGRCLQPCRRQFFITDSEGQAQYRLGQDYILSPKDLCTIDFIDKLIAAGIGAFKIEGRIRSPEYIGAVTSIYRKGIDAFFKGTLDDRLKAKLKEQLRCVYNRGFSSGFYFGAPQQDISRRLEQAYEKVFIGEVLRFYKKIGVAEVKVQNECLRRGEAVLFIGAKTPARVAKVRELQINHKAVATVRRGCAAGVKVPFPVKAKDKVFRWQKKILN